MTPNLCRTCAKPLEQPKFAGRNEVLLEGLQAPLPAHAREAELDLGLRIRPDGLRFGPEHVGRLALPRDPPEARAREAERPHPSWLEQERAGVFVQGDGGAYRRRNSL
jgi:hypothetical protein